MDEYARAEAALDAVAGLIEAVEAGGMVQRFVLLAEVVDTDGERAVWGFVPPGAKAWDSLGLLEYGRQIEQAQLVADRQ